MAFCKYCGSPINEGAAFCPKCGQALTAEQPAQQPQPEPQPQPQPVQQPQAQPVYAQPAPQPAAPANNLFNPEDHSAEYDPEDIAKNKDRALISYLGIFFLPPLLGAKHSPYAQFHAKQGFNLFLLCVAVMITMTLITVLLGLTLVPALIIIGGILSFLAYAFLAVLMVFGIINALTGKVKGLPLIGGIRILK